MIVVVAVAGVCVIVTVRGTQAEEEVGEQLERRVNHLVHVALHVAAGRGNRDLSSVTSTFSINILHSSQHPSHRLRQH